jgi:hypothetical protein
MRAKWVLVGFGILYVVVALAFVPSEIWRSSSIEPTFSVLTDVVWSSMTFISIGLVGAMAPLAKPLANATDVAPSPIMEGMFALICLAVAAFSSVQLLRKNLTPGGYGTYTFLLALSLVAMVRFTMYSWSNFA